MTIYYTASNGNGRRHPPRPEGMHIGPVIGSTKVGFMMDHNEVLVLAGRVRAALAAGHVTEKRMFGGVTFLVNGNMLCCASKQGLMVRVGRDAEAAALSLPFARPCLGTGRHMTGFVMVERAGISDAEILSRWLDIARAYVERLPPKTASAEV